MRKIIYIIVIVLITGLVGIFCWQEFQVPAINFVVDQTRSDTPNHLKIQRLYAAEVDHDAFRDALDAISTTTEYTEEEIIAAAKASGKPEFYPSFNFGIYRYEDEIRIKGFADTEFFDGQENNRFTLGNVSLELIVSQGDLILKDIDVSTVNTAKETIVKAVSEKQAVADVSGSAPFLVTMSGKSGSITIRLVYDVTAETLIPHRALEEQLVELHAIISPGDAINVGVEWILEPFSSLEEVA